MDSGIERGTAARASAARTAARAVIACLLAGLLACAIAPAALAAGGAQPAYARVEPACAAPAPGEASCFALGRVPVPASQAGRPGVSRLAARPAAPVFGPAGGLTPALLASAYGFDPGSGGSGTTVAIVDAFDDPNIESDLAAFSTQYGLAPCTEGNGCFTKLEQSGTPPDTRGWSVEISLDVETVHAACPKCKIVLVESRNAQMTNLGAAVTNAVELGAAVVSNSYGGSEEPPAPGAAEQALFEHPGRVIVAATGDFGYDGWTVSGLPASPEEPASMPGVVSVGGTTLHLGEDGRRASETVWDGNGPSNAGDSRAGVSGGGCSVLFGAPFWQRYAPGFAATGCGEKRLSADVSAVADPATGFDVYDTYNCGKACTELKGKKAWSTIGGTSLSTPLISAMYGLAGGANGISYPAMTLYAHLGGPSLFDVAGGGNGWCDEEGPGCSVGGRFGCERRSACNAVPGYDGPSGVGAPASLEAFRPVPEEEQLARRKAEEAVAAELAARRAEEEAARHAGEGPAAGAKPPGQPAGGQGAAAFKAEQAAVPDARLRGSSFQVSRSGAVTVRIACPAGERSCEGTVRIRTLSAVIGKNGARVLTLASGRFKVAGGRVVAVTLHLTRAARALLARRGRLRVRVVILARDPAGASHSSQATATLTLRRR
ncbi:MAG TPA: S53 family peptidase [Solirubrobacteraceae bacterium]|jgi:hypothetical protein|nr:S53 family peptidase [Solirubrobacteraceae bacterium]